MSKLMRLLAALWAAVWVRWRLLAGWARRVFGRRPVAAVRFSDEPPLGKVPTEGIDYDPKELPYDLLHRLDGVRAGLLDHARAVTTTPTRQRRVRRTASLVTASLLTLAALGAGAAALVGGTTGVPAVDRLLGTYEERLSKPEAADRGGQSGQDAQPSTTKASEPIEVRLPDGSLSVTTFYVSRSGKICNASVALPRDDAGALGCESPSDVARAVGAGGGARSIEVQDGAAIVRGYVSEDVESLSGVGPDGHLDVRLGTPWSPAVPGVPTLQPFVALGRFQSDGGSLDPAELQRLITVQSYTFEGTTRTGRTVQIGP